MKDDTILFHLHKCFEKKNKCYSAIIARIIDMRYYISKMNEKYYIFLCIHNKMAYITYKIFKLNFPSICSEDQDSFHEDFYC